MVRRATTSLTWLAAAVGLVVLAAPAMAGVILTDANTVAEFDFESFRGMYTWEVDGVDHMFQQWFWVRVGDVGGELSFDELAMVGSPVLEDTNADQVIDAVTVNYTGVGLLFEVRFSVVGGAPGTGGSIVFETITITNALAESLDVRFFQYTDLDLNGSEDGDTIEILGGNTAVQSKSAFLVAETVVTRQPSHYQADDYWGGLVDDLGDDQPTTLNDFAGPIVGVDAVWAFEWDETIGPGDSVVISKNKNIIPEPATLALMGGGLAIALATKKRKR